VEHAVSTRAALRTAVAALWLAAIAGPAAPGVVAATTFDQPTATSTYASSIQFRQPVTTTARMKRVEILLELPGALGPETVEVDDTASQPGRTTLRYSLDATGGLLPNTVVEARWRLTAVDGTVELGPPVRVRYEDTRFKWNVRAGDIVRVHWYDGSNAFGQRALDIGEKAIRDASQLLGVKETEPVDFFLYADREAFYQALGPGTRENVGGQANTEIRTLFALITQDQIGADWVGTVIRHELTHLVFNTAVDNPYHFPPRWLNEGLAVYLSEGYGAADRTMVRNAANDGSLIPLASLAGNFPTSREAFFLAYAESVSSIDYLVRTYGRDALVKLIKSYAAGVTDDEASKAALGVDVATFDTAWRAELKAKEPVVHGPQPAPPGPLPPGWTQANGSAGVPLGTAAPAPTRGAAASPGSAPSSPAVTGERGWSPLPILIGVLAVLVALAGVVYGRNRRGRRPPVAITPESVAPGAAPEPVAPEAPRDERPG
jgi:peptidase MA superfamily protein